MPQPPQFWGSVSASTQRPLQQVSSPSHGCSLPHWQWPAQVSATTRLQLSTVVQALPAGRPS